MNFYDNGDGTYRYSYVEPEKPKKEKKEHKTIRFLAKLLVIAVVIGFVGGGVAYGTFRAGLKLFPMDTNGSNGVKSGSSISGTAVSTAVAVEDVSDIVKNVMPAIVQVTNMSVVEYRGFFGRVFSEPVESAGSGVIIAEDDNYIYVATNNHVISRSQELTVTFSTEGQEAVSAELQGSYPDKDLAVVKVKRSDISEETMKGINIAALANSDEIEVGQATVAIGNALGYGQSVTTGVVSAIGREVTVQDEEGRAVSNQTIQTDAAINPGNSGGALLNIKGEVIGIVSAKYSDTDVEGMGYAIPINQAKEVVDELIATGSYQNKEDVAEAVEDKGAYLGIYGGMDIDSGTSSRYNMPKGVYVSQVVDGSGADEAGIEGGDVIRAVNGKEVTSMEELKEALKVYSPGETVRITVADASNNYEDTDFVVTLGDKNEQ